MLWVSNQSVDWLYPLLSGGRLTILNTNPAASMPMIANGFCEWDWRAMLGNVWKHFGCSCCILSQSVCQQWRRHSSNRHQPVPWTMLAYHPMNATMEFDQAFRMSHHHFLRCFQAHWRELPSFVISITWHQSTGISTQSSRIISIWQATAILLLMSGAKIWLSRNSLNTHLIFVCSMPTGLHFSYFPGEKSTTRRLCVKPSTLAVGVRIPRIDLPRFIKGLRPVTITS